MKSLLTAVIVVLTVSLTGCGGRIGTGNVGVRTNFNKSIELTEIPPGWYGAFLTHVDEFVTKQTELALTDLKPKAKDNLSLQDLDVSVFYTVNPASVAELLVKYSGMSVLGDHGLWYPAFSLVERFARGSVYDAVATLDSLTIHTKRAELEKSIHDRLQKDLDTSDPGVFTITQVVVRQVVTDPTLEDSIRQAVRVQKQIEAKQAEVNLARAEAERKRVEAEGTAKANGILSASLTDQYIRYKQVEALQSFAGQGTHTVLLPQGASTNILVGGK